MALMLKHPDYIGNQRRLASYIEFLDEFREDDIPWRVLPREVSEWWRSRPATTLRRVEGWKLDGPTEAKCVVELIAPSFTAA
jgi:hypothetical protein